MSKYTYYDYDDGRVTYRTADHVTFERYDVMNGGDGYAIGWRYDGNITRTWAIHDESQRARHFDEIDERWVRECNQRSLTNIGVKARPGDLPEAPASA